MNRQAQGIEPRRPELIDELELFEAITGCEDMCAVCHTPPAWGLTHSDDELWPLIALVTRFPDFADTDYGDLLAAAREAADLGAAIEARL
ncbi:MAG: hypothetical protein ACNA7W_03510 [Pseudomonadales bacterium]